MKILVINLGSSTLKYQLFSSDEKLCLLFGQTLKHSGSLSETFSQIFTGLQDRGHIKSIDDIDIYGHRVVHGGEDFKDATFIDEDVIAKIEKLCSLAPLHNPANLEGIKKAMQISGNKPQVAVFDTAFHQSIPQQNYLYPIPKEHYYLNKIRRYGFHGSSHEYVAKKAAKQLQKPLNSCNLITVHLGNGASICAIKEGKSYDTTMGFTPLEGLMMGTRSGDIDSSIIFELYKKGKSIPQIEKMLNLHSGLFAIAKQSDFEILQQRYEAGDSDAVLAIDMFTHRIKKYIGAYKEILQNVDGIVFTGGIGENSALVRQKSTNGVDSAKNSDPQSTSIEKDGYGTKIFVIATDEQMLIAQKCVKITQNGGAKTVL